VSGTAKRQQHRDDYRERGGQTRFAKGEAAEQKGDDHGDLGREARIGVSRAHVPDRDQQPDDCAGGDEDIDAADPQTERAGERDESEGSQASDRAGRAGALAAFPLDADEQAHRERDTEVHPVVIAGIDCHPPMVAILGIA
jgi:hypothetical protein